MAVENQQNTPPPTEVSEEVKEARRKVLLSDKVVQANMEAADAAEKGEVYYGGTK